jgi:ribosome-associated heat shock protein Hsp15
LTKDSSQGVTRLDKWLWHARATRTRTTAQQIVSAGKVRIDGLKVRNPGHRVRVGNVLTLALAHGVFVWRVLATAERRGSAQDAAGLYERISGPTGPEPRA